MSSVWETLNVHKWPNETETWSLKRVCNRVTLGVVLEDTHNMLSCVYQEGVKRDCCWRVRLFDNNQHVQDLASILFHRHRLYPLNTKSRRGYSRSIRYPQLVYYPNPIHCSNTTPGPSLVHSLRNSQFEFH